MDRDHALRLGGASLAAIAVGAGLLMQGVLLPIALVGAGLAAALPLLAGRRRAARPAAPVDDPTAVEEIDRLRRRGWRVVHAARSPQGTVRHALVGPGGALAAVTYGGSGRLRARAIPARRLAAAEADRVRLEALVGRPAGALVVVGRGFMAGPERVRGVDVVPVRALAEYLESRGPVLDDDAVEAAWRAISGAC